MEYPEIDPFLEPLAALQRLLDRHKQQGVIVGGIAASLLGKPRFTQDLDAVFILALDELDGFLALAQMERMVPRIENAAEFARQHRVLLLKHEPTDTQIDIALGILPFEVEMVERSNEMEVGASLKLRLPTVEDLIIMKAIANRPKDLEDIRHLVIKHKELDVQRIQHWVLAFSEALESPKIWQDIESNFS